MGYGGWRTALAVARAKQKAPEFATVKRGPLVRTVTETGTIASALQVEVKSKVAGRITALLVDEGDRVRAGQLLARVDPTEVQRQLNQVAAELEAARARLRQSEVVAAEQRENTRLAIGQAAARLAAAQANLRQLESGSRPEEIARAEAQVARAESEVAEARAALARTLELEEAHATAREDAEAALAAARAQLQRLEAGARPQEIAQARANVAQAQAAAEEAARILERKQKLHAKGFLSRNELDVAQATFDRAAAALEDARQHLALLEAGAHPEELAAAKARVRQAEIAARSAATQAEQAIASAKARVASAEAALQSARQDLALVRAGPRPEQIAAARAQVEEARLALEQARAGRARDAAAEAEVAAARADVRRITERLEAMRMQLADTNLTAPISGTVTARHIQPGELVASGVSGLSAGMPVVTIADLSHLLVRVRLNEVDVAQVRPGQQAEVRVDAYPGVVFPGRVRRISPSAGSERRGQTAVAQDTQIVRFDVEVALDRPDPRLRTGMTARVDIILEKRESTLYVVREALSREENGWVAYVVEDPHRIRHLTGAERARLNSKEIPTRKVSVKAGIRDEMRIEVLSGLKEGDLLLIQDTGRVERRRFQVQ